MINCVAAMIHRITQDDAEFSRKGVGDNGLALDQASIAVAGFLPGPPPVDEHHSLHLLFQSVGQMTEAWGREGTRAWIDAAAWVGYAAIRAGGAGKDLSDQLGAHGVLAWSEGDNQGRQKPFGLNFGSTSRGVNVNVHEIRRSLIAAAEMQQDLRDDEIIIVPANGPPIRCGRAIFFRRRDMVTQIATNRFGMMAGPSAE